MYMYTYTYIYIYICIYNMCIICAPKAAPERKLLTILVVLLTTTLSLWGWVGYLPGFSPELGFRGSGLGFRVQGLGPKLDVALTKS